MSVHVADTSDGCARSHSRPAEDLNEACALDHFPDFGECAARRAQRRRRSGELVGPPLNIASTGSTTSSLICALTHVRVLSVAASAFDSVSNMLTPATSLSAQLTAKRPRSEKPHKVAMPVTVAPEPARCTVGIAALWQAIREYS